MIGVLSDVVRNIVVLIIIVTILDLVLPRNDFRPFVNMVVGLVLMLMLLSPLRTLLQIPAGLEPVLDLQLSISENDILARQNILEQMNWDMTLARYRELLEEKIATVLNEEKLEAEIIRLDLVKDINHLEFGQPRKVVVNARPDRDGGTGNAVRPVEKIRVRVGQAPESTAEAVRYHGLERKVAAVLGIGEEKVEVYVLNP